MSNKREACSRKAQEPDGSKESETGPRPFFALHIIEVARQTVNASIAYCYMERLLSTGCVLKEQADQAHKIGDQKTLDGTLARMTADGGLFWYHLQAFLIASGNLSKLFWPSPKGDSNRGIFLRKFFNVEETSPLRNRKIRNHFEHFDEKLDGWGSDESAREFADGLVVFPGQLDPVECGMPPGSCMRVFYVSGMCASFYGEKCQLQPVADEVNRIFPVAFESANALHGSLQKRFIEKRP